jgi:3'-phosphoadenosine 5'-phosphosulfate sulfotransferase (PAPS reductase)/FAD synthetase
VRKYAEWLGSELVIIRPEKTFRQYAEEIGMWPSLHPPRFRWCYFNLKLGPTVKYIKEEYRRGDLVALGVKKGDSDYRKKFYTSVFFERDYGGIKARIWAPLLHVDDNVLQKLIERFKIPYNPMWRLGFSGECLCLAGISCRKLKLVLRYFPEERDMLLEIDRAINRNRRSNTPSAPPCVYQAGFKTLEEFYQKVVKQQLTLDYFIPYTGKSCEGIYML